MTTRAGAREPAQDTLNSYENSLLFWSLFNALLPLFIPFLVFWFIFWITNRTDYYGNTLNAFADGQLCILAVTLSLITYYELRTINDFAMSTWSVVIAVFSAIILGLINAFNDSEKAGSALNLSKPKMAWSSIFVAITAVISAIYSHYLVNLNP